MGFQEGGTLVAPKGQPQENRQIGPVNTGPQDNPERTT